MAKCLDRFGTWFHRLLPGFSSSREIFCTLLEGLEERRDSLKVLIRFSPYFTEFYSVLLGFTGSERIVAIMTF